jgi:hypothetical protein
MGCRSIESNKESNIESKYYYLSSRHPRTVVHEPSLRVFVDDTHGCSTYSTNITVLCEAVKNRISSQISAASFAASFAASVQAAPLGPVKSQGPA